MPWKPSDTDPRTFRLGQSWVLIPFPENGWSLQEPADSPFARLWACFCWLSWVAQGARTLVVTDVDPVSGTITFDAAPDLCDTSGDG